MPHPFSISFNNSSDDSDYVIIEQEEWAKDIGSTSKTQGILAIGSMIFGGNLPNANCGGLAEFNTPVYVYPSTVYLYFKFAVSHGNYLSKGASIVIREEVVQCGLVDTVRLPYPVHTMISMAWLGKCYDSQGNQISRPLITRNKRDLYFSKKAYGSIRVKYLVYRKTYMVNITGREDSIENNFESVAYAIWNSGIEFKEIQAPSGYDDTEGNCDNGIYTGLGLDSFGGSSEICTPDWGRGTYPTSVKADKFTTVDYCPQEITKEKIVESVESENEPGDECSDGPITTN